MAEVVFDKINKSFGQVHVVKDLDLVINDREFVVLVGPSGCGKSTSLRMVAGLETITSGEIRIGGIVANDVPPKDRDIAMVFQNYALYPHMTVFNNMAFGLKMRKFDKKEIDHRIRDAARILDIEHLLARKPKELSGGQRQRVAVGRAIVRRPQVFLFDEPLSNLDAKLRVQMRAELSRLHQTLKTTIIYVTHDQVEAMTMGTRIAIMNEGRLMQAGAPLEVYNHPKNRFVAAFIGSPSMNFFEGEIGNGAFRCAAFTAPIPADHSAPSGAVTLGIRPEDIHDSQFAAPSGKTIRIPAVADIVEPLGSQTIVNLTAGGERFVATVDPRTSAAPGKNLDVLLDLEKLHLFDPKDGRAI